jgi:hypothetical protein
MPISCIRDARDTAKLVSFHTLYVLPFAETDSITQQYTRLM